MSTRFSPSFPRRAARWLVVAIFAAGVCAGAAPSFPEHWGKPPKIQTRDYRPLPGGYGFGSSTLARWIQQKLDEDAAKKAAEDKAKKESPREKSGGK